jgi:pSer/pThr/pTyr-binding forkhead associated (FHA) protein
VPAEHKLAVRDGERVREVLLVGTVTVGRSPTCEISSADPRLSRTHAAFDVVGGDVVVRDLGSANGTTVNGARITEHRLMPGDLVEVGPFVVQLIGAPVAVSERRPPSAHSDTEATVMLPPRAREGAATSDAAPVAPAAPAVPARTSSPEDSSAPTVLLRRPPSSNAAPSPAAAPLAAHDAERRVEPPPAPVPQPVASSPSTAIKSPPPPDPSPEATPSSKVRRSSKELTFANAALLCIVPLVLISFLAGFVPTLTQPDERTPLLRAHYVALAASAVDLVKTSREPAMPIDAVTSALRRQAGVVNARIIGADGRVLAPLDQAGTNVPPPAGVAGASPNILRNADGSVEVQASATTADARPVLVSLTVDPERIHPAPPASSLATLLLIVSLGAAWLVARRVTTITNSRLSRLGEEIELLTTRQINAGHDPFSLSGGRRILDAMTFALSSAGRVGSDVPLGVRQADDGAAAHSASTASIEADDAFRIVAVDQGCGELLGMNVRTAPGTHLMDALTDQAVSDEVMRLVTLATSERVASGEVTSGDRGIPLAIEVSRGAAAAPISIRFRSR